MSDKASYRTITRRTTQAFRVQVIRATEDFLVGPDQEVVDRLTELVHTYRHDRLTFALIADAVQEIEGVTEYQITDLNGHGIVAHMVKGAQ